MSADDQNSLATAASDALDAAVASDLRDSGKCHFDGMPQTLRGQALNDFRAALFALPEAALLLTLDGGVEWANRVFGLMTERDAADCTNHPFHEFIACESGATPGSEPQAIERFIAQSLMAPDRSADYAFHLKGAGGRDLPVYFVGAPIVNEAGLAVGVVALGRDQSDLTECRRMLEDATRQIGDYTLRMDEKGGDRLTEVKQRARMLEELSITDELTKLYNRRYFFKRLQEEVSRAMRYGSSFSLVLLDIDHFKLINDTYGHVAGDMVLYELAGLLRGSARNMDVVARTGGEEFFILLPTIHEDHATIFCERLREKVAGYRFTYLPEDRRVTISLGLADFPRPNISDPDSLVRLVDSALYRAKVTRNTSFPASLL